MVLQLLWTPVDASGMDVALDPNAEVGTYTAPEKDLFLVKSLEEQTQFPRLITKIPLQDLETLAAKLNEACSRFPVDRWSLVQSCGANVVERKKAFLQALQEVVQNRVEWRLIESDVQPYESTDSSSTYKAMYAACAASPTIWIRFNF